MSASSKKKLRKELAAAQLTERQRAEQAEAKKLKAITVSFVAIMLVIALTAAGVVGIRAVNNSGIIDKKTIAAVVGEHELNSVMMNYYFTDYIRSQYQEWTSTYGESFISMMGLDTKKPLNEQYTDSSNKETWASHFLTQSLERAKSDFALYDKAMAEGFKLSEDEQAALDSNEQMLNLYATYSGFTSVNKYLQAMYGHGANVKSYNEYAKISTIAAAYHNAHSDSLTYNDAAIREHEKDKFDNYSSFTFASYYVNQTDYLTGGTKGADGKTTYSDEEKAAALKAAEDTAKSLSASADLDALDKAIAALEVNKDKTDAASTKNDNVKYTNIPSLMQKWLAEKDRKAGDITVIANETTTKDADGKETKTVSGYYVVLFQSRNDNLRKLANVRHILVEFEGGTTDSSGNKKYTDEEKATAKTEAERILQEWKDGNATEETFIELAKKYTDDTGSKETGGLYEDIHPESSFVETFRTWSIDVDRKPGDTGVIISEYGYHVMYYSSDDELTYRDYMIQEELRAADVEKWYNGLVDPVTSSLGKTNRLNLDLIVANIAGQ